jgi:5-(carboxyamino)imidazole ribonucleotide mutase
MNPIRTIAAPRSIIHQVWIAKLGMQFEPHEELQNPLCNSRCCKEVMIQLLRYAMPDPKSSAALVAVIMGSSSDWETMRHSVEILNELGVPNEHRILSAHRTPDATADFARKAAGRGLRVIIAGAGSAAHLAGVVAGLTELPVLGVPIASSALHGIDSLLSIAQMPGGIPVGTLAIGKAGAKNAAILAASILALSDEKIRHNLGAFRKKQTDAVLAQRVPK